MLHAAKVAASETYHRARASSHRHRYLVRQWGRRYVRVPLSASAAGGGQSGGGGCAGGQGAQHPARRVGDLAGGTARFRHLLRTGAGHPPIAARHSRADPAGVLGSARLLRRVQRTGDVHARDEVAGRRDARAAVRGRHGPAHLRHRPRVGRTFPSPPDRPMAVRARRRGAHRLGSSPSPSSPQELR